MTRAVRNVDMRPDEGSGTVEFALVAPLLLLLIVGILDFARAVNAYVLVSNASREGASYAALRRDAPSDAIATVVAQRSSPLDAGKLVVSVTYHDGTDFRPWPPPPSAHRAPVRVQVSYSWGAATFIARFFPGGNGATMTASSTMVSRW